MALYRSQCITQRHVMHCGSNCPVRPGGQKAVYGSQEKRAHSEKKPRYLKPERKVRLFLRVKKGN